MTEAMQLAMLWHLTIVLVCIPSVARVVMLLLHRTAQLHLVLKEKKSSGLSVIRLFLNLIVGMLYFSIHWLLAFRQIQNTDFFVFCDMTFHAITCYPWYTFSKLHRLKGSLGCFCFKSLPSLYLEDFYYFSWGGIVIFWILSCRGLIYNKTLGELLIFKMAQFSLHIWYPAVFTLYWRHYVSLLSDFRHIW